MFQRAADLHGRSLGDSAIATLHKEAVQTIETMGIIRLNAEESLKMAQAILNPREPGVRSFAKKQRIILKHICPYFG